MNKLLKLAGLFAVGVGGAAAVAWASRRHSSSRLGRVGGPRETLATMPKGRWWTRVPNEDRECYATKRDALAKFLDENQELTESYDGPGRIQDSSLFESVTAKTGVPVRSIAEAVWLSIEPPRSTRSRSRAFCLTDIDIDMLNRMDVAKNHPVGFQLPDYVYGMDFEKRQAEYYRRKAEREAELDPVPF